MSPHWSSEVGFVQDGMYQKKSTKIHTDLLLVFKNPIKKAYGCIYSELEM